MTRAAVFIKEWDQSQRVPSFPGVYCGIVAPFEKGLVNDKMLITSETQMLKQLTNDETVKVGATSAYYSMLAALQKSNKIWAVRSANNAKYGAMYFKVDKPYHTHGISANSGLSTLMLNHTSEADLAAAKVIYSTLSTGDRVTVSSAGGTVPAPLVASTEYFVIKYDEETYKIRLASSLENARDGVFIELSDVGSGSISLNIPADGYNGESEYGITKPKSYMLNSSDGKLAGNESTFTVDVNNDDLNCSANFYNMASTGDACTLSAVEFPAVDSGADLNGSTTYYIIKDTAVANKVKIARTLSDANSGIFIGFLTQGDSLNLTLSNKLKVDSSVVADNATEQFTVDVRFFNACATGDAVIFDCTGTYPTVASGAAFNNTTTYYIIKGTSNKVQLARTSEEASLGTAIGITDDGSGTMIFNLSNKDISSSITTDLSNDTLTVSTTFFEWISTGFACVLSSTGVLPEGLVAGTTYYIIKTSVANKIKLASTAVNAALGVAVDILDGGTGIHTILDTHNTELIGLDQKLMLVHTYTPCAEELYVKSIHYPYGDSSSWTDDEKTAADTVKIPGCFILYVYKKDANNNLYEVESHLLSRTKGLKDGNGKNTYCEEAIEASSYIRIVDNTTLDETLLPVDQSDFIKLTNGSAGDAVTDSNMLQSLDVFASRRDVFVTVLMDGGWTTPAYQKQGLIQLCENRKDCVAILNVPFSYEDSSDYMNQILKYRKEDLNANTSYAGLYCSHLYIQDKYNDRKIYVPADGYITAAISETASNYEIWYPPAGASRGQLNVLDVRRRFTEGEMDVLYDNGINPIDFYPGRGIRIWGQKTLLARPSALDRMNVRLLLIVIEPAIAEFLEDFVFEFNDKITRARAKSGIQSYMDDIRARRGVYDYMVKCDEENNTPEVIDANKMKVDLYVQPVKAAEFIDFTTIITRTSSTFTTNA